MTFLQNLMEAVGLTKLLATLTDEIFWCIASKLSAKFMAESTYEEIIPVR